MDDKRNQNPRGFQVDMSPLHDMMKRMDSFFQDSFKPFHNIMNTKSFWVHVREEKTDFIIEAELPGFSLKQIEIEIVDSKVFIRAKNNTQELQQDIHNNHSLHKHAAERLERVVTLPFIIPKKTTQASFHEGLLTITVPKPKSSGTFLNINEK